MKSSFFDFTKSGCKKYDPERNEDVVFYFRAYCESKYFFSPLWIINVEEEVSLPGGLTMNKKEIGFVIATFDAMICILYVIMLFL